jgi:L-ascorbate metabolism protein UlaG (beta-lactamase superfamily)
MKSSLENYFKLLLNQKDAAKGTINLNWMGCAGICISDSKTCILIDPFVSRYSLLHVGLRRPLKPDTKAIHHWIKKTGCQSKSQRTSAVIVSHSHYDHALDAPYFAKYTQSPLFGSSSTCNIGRGAGLPENQTRQISNGQTEKFGKFTVQFIESEHGPALFGRIPYPGTIAEPLFPPKSASDYKLGGTFSILIKHPAGNILHHGSAGYIPGQYQNIHTDILLLGIAGRKNTRDYLKNTVDILNPKMVIPIHLDNFFKPLDSPIKELPSVNLKEFWQTSMIHKPHINLKTLPIGKNISILEHKY